MIITLQSMKEIKLKLVQQEQVERGGEGKYENCKNIRDL